MQHLKRFAGFFVTIFATTVAAAGAAHAIDEGEWALLVVWLPILAVALVGFVRLNRRR